MLEQLSVGQDRPFGRLKMNVPMSFGEMFLHKPIADYVAAYPDVVVEVDFDDKRVHLVEEGYDLIVRIGVLEDSGLLRDGLVTVPFIPFICVRRRILSRAMACRYRQMTCQPCPPSSTQMHRAARPVVPRCGRA